MNNSLDLLLSRAICPTKFSEYNNYQYSSFYNYQFSEYVRRLRTDETNKLNKCIQVHNKILLIDNKPHHMIHVYDKNLISKIMKIYLDEDNLGIFYCLRTPQTIQEIANYCKIPISTAYRRISFLLENGYLLVSGCQKNLGKRSKSIKYEKTISGMTIDVNDKLLVTLLIKKIITDESELLRVMEVDF